MREHSSMIHESDITTLQLSVILSVSINVYYIYLI